MDALPRRAAYTPPVPAWQIIRPALGVVAALALAACAEPRVQLRYRLPGAGELRYRWTIETATAAETPAGATDRRTRLVLIVSEIPLGAGPEGTARLRMVLAPQEAVEDGAPVPPGPPVTLELEVTPAGRVARVLRAADLPPETASSLELDRLLHEVRPPLPPERVALGARWPAPLASRGERSAVDLRGEGRLLGFELAGRRRLAVVEVRRSGPVVTSQQVGRGEVSLRGTSDIRTVARVDLDRGELVASDSRAESRFAVAPEGTAPTGTVRVTLVTRVERLH